MNNEQEIYNAYPRKVGKPAALKAIAKALKGYPAPYLLARAKAYAEAQRGQDQQFIPHPATWFNEERFNDTIEEPRQNLAFDLEHLRRIERRMEVIQGGYDMHVDWSKEHKQEFCMLREKRKEIMERVGFVA